MGKERQYISRIPGKCSAHARRLGRFRKDPVDLLPVRHFPESRLHIIGHPLHIKPAEHIFKLQLLEELVGRACIRIPVTGRFQVKLNVRVDINGRQYFAELRLLPVLLQVFAGAGRFYLGRMFVCIFNAAIILYDLRGRLLAHPRHAGNIVRGIAHQRLHIDEFFRRDAVTLFHVRRIVILHLGPALLRFRDADFHMFRGKLQGIPVAGDDGDVHPLLLAKVRDRPQKIVRLQAFFLDDLDIHGSQDFLDHRHLLPQFLGHRFSRPFVIRKHLMPERGRMHVKRHRQIFRLFFIQDLKHNIQESVYRIRVKAFRIRQIRHAVKRAVQDTVSVYQYDFLSHQIILQP